MHPRQPIDPSLHIFATRLAYRLAGIVQPCLVAEELQMLIAEYYRAIVEDMQHYEQRKAKRA
jgi:hypothetical protein